MALTWNTTGDVAGKIVAAPSVPPHESQLRKLQSLGAKAVLYVRPGNYPAGFSMYIVDGYHRSDIWIPTMELVFTPSQKNVLSIPEGSFIQCIPTENLHKKERDTKFQFVMNLVQSFWEMGIVGVASYRISQFYALTHLPFLSIAPVCCMLEGFAALLRLSFTMVDPFLTYRMIPERVSLFMSTISWPFSEAAGMLLVFFCTLLPPVLSAISL